MQEHDAAYYYVQGYEDGLEKKATVKCRPHRWNIEAWLPIIKGSDIEAPLECLLCGRVLAIAETTPNMRASMAHAIATRFLEGEEYSETHEAVFLYFNHHLDKFQSGQR